MAQRPLPKVFYAFNTLHTQAHTHTAHTLPMFVVLSCILCIRKGIIRPNAFYTLAESVRFYPISIVFQSESQIDFIVKAG